MNNELVGVIEDDNFNVKVQITESGPQGIQGIQGEVTLAQLDAVQSDLTAHKEDYVRQSSEGFAGQAKDLQSNKTFTIVLEKNEDGLPRINYKEVI